jgi:hypothetical protein
MKKNDFSVSLAEKNDIREQADLLLREAGAYGVFPTPVKDIVKAAALKVHYIQDLVAADCAPENVKRAMGKLQGFLHRGERGIFIDKALKTPKRKFVSLHEVAHERLPEHRATYQILEDSESELDDETRDGFERAANCFASDVLFQLDRFTNDARDSHFGIGPPVKVLSKRFGTSIYSTLRRYTMECGKRAALLVCDPSEIEDTPLKYRRFIPSPEFNFELKKWPESFREDSWFARNRPRNQFLKPTNWIMKTRDGRRVACIVEGYDTSRNVFFFIYPEEGAA